MLITEAEALAFWRSALDPGGVGLREALAAEIADFRSEPIAAVLEHMSKGTDEFADLWRSANIDVSDQSSVERFYRDQFTEAYELANWHAGVTTGTPPLNYARAALLARARGWTRALDFGSGIGSGSLCFATAGCEVHSADIAVQLLTFVEYRMRRHRFTPSLINLSEGDRPRAGYYDVVTCFDVLEHVPNQLEKLRELSGYLRPGGYLFVNLMDDSIQADRPMHISSAGEWLSLVRKTDLVPAWSLFGGEAQILQKQRLGRIRNVVGTLVDRWQGATGAGLRERTRS